MVIDILDKLIDRLIQLIKHKEESDKKLFENFISPIYSDFEAIHKNYLDNFKKYRESLLSTNDSIELNHPVLDMMKTDSYFTAGQRKKVWKLMTQLDSQIAANIVSKITKYLSGLIEGFEDLERPADLQPARQRLSPLENSRDNPILDSTYSSLKNIFSDLSTDVDKKARAIITIDYMVAAMQQNYAEVTLEYYLIKKKLLSPK